MTVPNRLPLSPHSWFLPHSWAVPVHTSFSSNLHLVISEQGRLFSWPSVTPPTSMTTSTLLRRLSRAHPHPKLSALSLASPEYYTQRWMGYLNSAIFCDRLSSLPLGGLGRNLEGLHPHSRQSVSPRGLLEGVTFHLDRYRRGEVGYIHFTVVNFLHSDPVEFFMSWTWKEALVPGCWSLLFSWLILSVLH